MLLAADSGTAAAVSAVAVAFISTVGGLIYLVVQQRGARQDQRDIKTATAETKATVEETKAAVTDVATSLDTVSIADLLNQSNRLLEQATSQLLRCEERERQYVLVIKTMGDKIAVLEGKVETFERVLAGQPNPPRKRTQPRP